jgi:hypothetical protein
VRVSDPIGSGLPGLEALPSEARLWCFGVGRPLTPEEEGRVLGEVDPFLAQWKAHGAPLAATREWREGRFLLVGVDERVTPPSGCSIDALTRILKGLEEGLGVRILGGGDVWYRETSEGGAPRRISRQEFRELAERGEVTPGTPVFDLSLTRVSDLREGRWERPARESWLRRYFE